MLMELVIFLGLMLILTLALMDTAGMRSRAEERLEEGHRKEQSGNDLSGNQNRKDV